MNKLIAELFLIGLSIVFLSNCNNQSESAVEKEKVKAQYSVDSMYAGWQTAEGEKITFRYPDSWTMKVKDFDDGTKIFGLIEKTEKDYGDFVLLEIYEIKTQNKPFKDFKFSSIDWLSKRFNNKINVRNTEDIKFKGAEARKYEVEIPRDNTFDPAELYAVNGISRYYLLFAYKYEKTDSIEKNIMNSILLYK